jgi:hypothetical protein
MAKILSFEVSDGFHARLVAMQQKEGFAYLSPFLRECIEYALGVLEQRCVKSEEDSTNV